MIFRTFLHWLGDPSNALAVIKLLVLEAMLLTYLCQGLVVVIVFQLPLQEQCVQLVAVSLLLCGRGSCRCLYLSSPFKIS